MQLSLRLWPDMRLTWVSGCAIVHSGPEPGAAITALVTKASGAAELAVVVTSHTVRLLPPMMNELADLLVDRLPPRCSRVRLVAWNSGCLHDDRPAPAYQLATRLGVEVVAPAGPLLGVPGGSLFAAAGRGAQRPGGWWRFAPGSAPSRVGWRYPVPSWDADLAEVGDLGNGLVVDQVPAGLWLHRSGYRSMTDLVFSVPVDADSPALVVSHPDEEPLRPEELAHALAVLPRRIVDRLVFTPYGPDPVSDGRLGEVAASLLGAPARTRPGLPLYGSGGQRALVTVDGEGRPLWQPFAREVRCNPRTESTEAADWINPAPEVLSEPIAPATFALGPGWAAEVIEAGLWIRPADAPEPADWARNLPLDVEECTIVVGTPSGAYPPPPSTLLAALLERLPADARSRIRFAVPRGAGDDVMSLTAALSEQLPGKAEVRIVAPAGRRRARMAEEPVRPLREPTPYPVRAAYQPTPSPAQPTIQPAAPAHAATESLPPVVQPTPYPPQPVLRPTPYPPQPTIQPAPPAHAATESLPPVLEPTPYPPHPVVQPTPYPPHPVVQPTPYPPHPVVQPTPYPPQPAVRSRGRAPQTPGARPSEPLPFPPSSRAGGRQGARPSPLPPSALPPIPPAPVPPATHAARQPVAPIAPVSPAPISPAPISPAPMASAPVPPASIASAPVPPASIASAPVPPAPMASAPVPPVPMASAPVPPAPMPPAPISPVPFAAASAPPPAARQPGPPSTAAPRGGQRARGPRQSGPVVHQQWPPPPPMASPPSVGSETGAQPQLGYPAAGQAAPQAMPQPGQRPSPARPASHQPAPETKADDSQDLLQRTEIRSHRTAAGKGGRGGGRDDEKATASDASELTRLLGFFDEIRKARAWDEEPAGSRPGAS
ncbi:hypothetical protein HC031_30445 [Planosporangium thailandense]|uniref:Basic proline-rich protein n=1 Tax=Planosporangium thailandense TaxID=765197 RepID=A0ABX0Y6G8_9ACTN|nr:hypothetical protein [Planosporangium thailandense]NJC74001.1 hypothetical protein [Planosporangium thailandense]